MSALQNPTAIVYGGFRFPVETETVGISVIPQFDEAGRTVIYNRYVFTIRTILAGTKIDAAVRAVVRQLSKPAYPFLYSGTGLGVAVNVGGIRDVVWGPTPLGCEVKPFGAGNAVELTWKVEVHIPDCSDAVFAFAPMEFNYGLSFSIDKSGFTTRRYTGFVRVPMTRNRAPLDRTLPDSVDYYREEINPPAIPGFRRIPGEFTINPAKNRLDFNVVDEQFNPNIPPPGIVEAEGSHTVAAVPGKLTIWTCTLSATYEVAVGSGATFATARDAFWRLLRDRVGWTMFRLGIAGAPIQQNPNAQGQNGGQGGTIQNEIKTKGAVVPVSFTIDEPEIYGRPKVRFSCTYTVSGASLADMLEKSGQFRPVPDSNWRLWSGTMQNTLGPRGHANLVFSPGEDKIVDLCGATPRISLLSSPNFGNGGLAQIPVGIFPQPTPDTSWISWENVTKWEPDNATVPVLTLATRKLSAGLTGLPLIGGLIGQFAGAAGPGNLPDVPPPNGMPPSTGTAWRLPRDDVFFTPANPVYEALFGGSAQQRKQSGFLFMTGSAVRVWYNIPMPVWYTWGKVKLIPANRPDRGEGFFAGAIGDCGWPVWGARWSLRYFIADMPTGVDLPATQPPFSKS